jgi:hypothetical protein
MGCTILALCRGEATYRLLNQNWRNSTEISYDPLDRERRHLFAPLIKRLWLIFWEVFVNGVLHFERLAP